jgi:hypothetical protein
MSSLDALRDSKTMLLTSYKRDGSPVGTPVSVAFDGDRAFFRSYDRPRVGATSVTACACRSSQMSK